MYDATLLATLGNDLLDGLLQGQPGSWVALLFAAVFAMAWAFVEPLPDAPKAQEKPPEPAQHRKPSRHRGAQTTPF